MIDQDITDIPQALPQLEQQTKALEFDMPSERQTGALLRTLAASKPGGHLLELGTGTGLATAWMLDGMDDAATFISVDIDPKLSAVAKDILGDDKRLSLVIGDGANWLDAYDGPAFDLIFADIMPGKYEKFEEAWRLLAIGGFYVIDDMNPQDNWPDGHDKVAAGLLKALDERTDCKLVRQSWASGIVVVVRTS